MTKLEQKNTLASKEKVGPMRFWSFWGPASVAREWGLKFVELNACELQSSGRLTPSAGEDMTHTHTPDRLKLFS